MKLIEEPQLLLPERRGRILSGGRAKDRLRGLRRIAAPHGLDASRESLDGRMLEDQFDRKLDLKRLTDPRQHSHRLKRLATEGEEVVAHSDDRDAEHCTPDLQQRVFNPRARRNRAGGDVHRGISSRPGLHAVIENAPQRDASPANGLRAQRPGSSPAQIILVLRCITVFRSYHTELGKGS